MNLIRKLTTRVMKNLILAIVFIALLICMMGCVGKGGSYKNSLFATSIDISELIGQPMSVAVERFGEYRNSYNSIGSPICVFSDGLVMTKRNDLISSVTVDCSKISDKTQYSYKGINGSSTKDDVVKILGEPEDLQFTSDTYKRYPVDDCEFEVTYSDDGSVIKFTFEKN